MSDPSDSKKKVEDALKRWGWACGPEFWERYHRDAWVFNLVNALTRTTAEVDRSRALLAELRAIRKLKRPAEDKYTAMLDVLDESDAESG